jgi:hypothetical protein
MKVVLIKKAVKMIRIDINMLVKIVPWPVSFFHTGVTVDILFNTLIIVLFLLNLCRFYDFLYLSSQHRSNSAASCRRIDVMVHMIG